MSKGKIYLILLSVALLSVLFIPQGNAWPTSDTGGAYYVMEVDDAPTIDGQIADGEWNTDEEFFKETFSPTPNYEQGSPTGLTISAVMVIHDGTFYVKLTWENTVTDAATPNSMGIALSKDDPAQMAQTEDRKAAFFDGSDVTAYDYYNCLNSDNSSACSDSSAVAPGLHDDQNDLTAAYGFDGKPFFEFSFPMNGDGTIQDFVIDKDSPTTIEFVVNPYGDIDDEGHGAVGSNPLAIQYEERCFFCQPTQGMPTSAQIFNGFFAILISGIFLALFLAGRSDGVAKRLWKVDVSEDMAKESVIMEMAYYNSSFLSILIVGFFMMYSLIGLIYGIWAQWEIYGYVMNGIPLILGVVTMVDLLGRNENPQEVEGEKLGTDVSEAGKFWLVPTLFLAITLLMLVFIGIEVIA